MAKNAVMSTLRRQRDDINALLNSPLARVATKIANDAVTAFNRKPGLSASASPSFGSGASAIYITLWINGLDSFKDKTLARVLEKMTDAGMEVTSTDDLNYGSRDFRGRLSDGGKVEVSLGVYAALSDAPKGCRIVEVERKLVVPTPYEEVKRVFICND